MNLVVHDFAGHAFPAQLSRELARRGHEVVHAFGSGVETGRGALEPIPSDPASLRFFDVSDSPFERYALIGRVKSELRYGWKAAQLVRRLEPDAVLSGNCPLLAQALVWRSCAAVGAERVYWLQDFLGRGTRAVLKSRSPALGASVGAVLERLETRLLGQSTAIVAISPDFTKELERRGVNASCTVIQNWCPLDEVPPREKRSCWSVSHGLADRRVALYSGTLGLKHDPDLIVETALHLAGDGTVVVATEGVGREFLERKRAELGLTNLELFDFVPYEDFPDLLGAADVCLVLLEPDAATFSVPSKLLAYLAAGRPVVAAIPAANLAVRTLKDSGAGVAVDPGDRSAFSHEVRRLLQDGSERKRMGESARRYAEVAFDIGRIADSFESLLEEVISTPRAAAGRSSPSSP